MRVGIYARVSTTSGQTCENQLLELQRYVEVRAGLRRNTLTRV
jgi:DNA invertase Pin-like site-specific DNA recombinase